MTTTNSRVSQTTAIRQLKEHLQDAVALAGKYKREMGVLDQEELARLSNAATGAAYNPADFELRDRNGEQ